MSVKVHNRRFFIGMLSVLWAHLPAELAFKPVRRPYFPSLVVCFLIFPSIQINISTILYLRIKVHPNNIFPILFLLNLDLSVIPPLVLQL